MYYSKTEVMAVAVTKSAFSGGVEYVEVEAGFGLQIAGESGLCPTIVESGSYYSVCLYKN